MRINLYRRGACALLAAALACSGVVVPTAQAVPNEAGAKGTELVSAFNAETGLIETTILHTKEEGDSNKFAFSEVGWAAQEEDGHRWSSGDATAEATYYEVKFYGSEIDIYARRNHPMGKVKYTIDGDSSKSVECSLWAAKNDPEPTKIHTFDGLEEGVEHTLRAEYTGKPAEGKAGTTIDAAKVVVRHLPYSPTELGTAEGFDKIELKEAGKIQIKLTTEPDYVGVEDLSFSSEDDAIASVDGQGVVTAVGDGSTNIVVAPKANGAAKVADAIKIPVTVTGAPLLDGFISDVDTQWTQDRYAEALEEIEKNDASGSDEAADEAKSDAGLFGLLGAKADAAAPDDTAKLSAWKNDSAISEITLASAGKDVKNVTLEVTDFTDGGKKIDAKNVELSFVGSTKAYDGAFLGYGNQPNKYPQPTEDNRAESNDILLGGDPVSVGKGALQNVFVKVNVPKDAQPGNYTGTVKVSADGLDESLEFTYTLQVQDAELPDATEFGKTFDAELWQYPYTSAEYYGVKPFSDEHFEVLGPIMEIYKSIGGHAITTTIIEEAWNGQTYADPDADGGHDEKIHYPSMIRWEMDENGVMHYDFSDFDAWVEFNKSLGIGDKIVLYSIAPWHNGIKYYDADGNLQTITDEQNGKVGESEGNKHWRHFLKALIAHLEEKGWFDETYMAIDERGITHEAFDMVESVKNSKGESLKTAGAMDRITGADRVALAMRIDDLNIGDFAAQQAQGGYDDLLKKRSEAGLRTTLYSCTEHYPGNFSLSNPVESYWSIINAEKDGNTAGFLRWAYDAWVDDPLNDATHWSFEAGDCFLVYPGADKATVEEKGFEGLSEEEKTAKSSIRLERMAEGIRDANKIKKMRAEVTDMTDDIQAVYDKIETIANKNTNRKWDAVDAEMAKLDAEMSQFKLDLVTLTDQYIKDRTGAPTKLTITGGDKVEVGTTVKFSVTSDTASRGVTWSSSNPDIATVVSDGTVKGHKAGIATIKAVSLLNEKVVATKRIAIVPPSVPEVEVPEENKVAHYDFEGDAENDWGAASRSADATDGAVGEGVTFADGMKGDAAVVDGSDPKAQIEIDSGAFSLDGAKPWTVAFWAKSDKPLSQKTIAIKDEDSHYGFALRVDNADKPGLAVDLNGKWDKLTFADAPTVKEGEWNRFVLVQDPAVGCKLYIDGKFVQNQSWTVQHKAEVRLPVGIIGAEGFSGMIDELTVYNKALTAEEVAAQLNDFTDGQSDLGLEASEKTIYEGESFGISGNFGTDVSFEVKSDNIADDKGDVVSVSDDGVVNGTLRGVATIKVTSGGVSEEIDVTVKRNVSASNNLTPVLIQGEAEDKFMSDVFHPDMLDGKMDNKWDTSKQYYGQPDMIRVSKGEHEGRLITAFPQGHGHGPLVMMISDDEGKTWTQKKDIPSTWAGSLETPTMYALQLENGVERLMLITACPDWGNGDPTRGWQTSYSDDGGDTWTQYNSDNGGKPYWPTMNGEEGGPQNPAVVGMASLVQLYEDGKPAQKWMGIFHHQGRFRNYKTILTFEEKDGRMVENWSQPEPLFSEDQFAVEQKLQMCEIGMFRSPDGGRIVGLVRSQSHRHLSTMIYSDDEGKTWSDPIELPGSLSGERHKALYDPISGRLVITFREMNFDLDSDGKVAENDNDWICDDWGMWIGTYEQLMNQEDGEYRFRLDEDWAQNRFKGDTGYTGMTVNPETGMFVMDSYGHWDRAYSEKWGNGNVRTDLSYIRQGRFTLSELLAHYGFETEMTPIDVQVTFDYNYDGDVDKVETVKAGEVVSEPAAPTRDGFEFGGWFTNKECAEDAKYDFNIPVTDHITLYAKWTEVQDPEPEEPNKDELEELIEEAEKAETDGKSQSVVDEYEDALAAAIALLNDENATQEQIDAAINRLSRALKALEADDGGNTPVDPNKPTDPDDPTDPSKPADPDKPTDPDKNDPVKPNGGGKPGDGLPGTGDDALLYVGGAAAAGVAVLAGGVALARKRKDR